MKVATYCRISTDEERQPFSLESQEEKLNAYVFSQDGWQLVRTYTDQMSGKDVDRPGLQQALGDARAGRYQLLLVYKVDRLSRSLSGLVRILEQLQAVDVGFRSASEPFDTSTAAGRMMVQLLGVFAEFEREMIVERTRMGLSKKAAKGEWTGGTTPFGYRYDSESRVLVPIEDEADVVRTIFDRYVKDGWGSLTIAKWLNDNKELTRRRSNWTPARIIAILRNCTYVGKLPFGGEEFDSNHQPLVDENVFEAAGRLLDERGEVASKRRSNPSDYLLTPFLRCEMCGHGFVGTSANGRGGTYRYYTCFSRQRHGPGSCEQRRIPADRIEQRTIEQLLADLDDGTIFEEAARRGQTEWEERHSQRADEADRLQRKIDKARASLDKYLKAFEDGDLSRSTCTYRVKEIEKELTVLEANLATVEGEGAPEPVTEELLGDLRSTIERSVQQGAPQDVKALLKVVISRLLVDEQWRVQPYYVLPDSSLSGVRINDRSRRRTGIEPARELSPPHWF